MNRRPPVSFRHALLALACCGWGPALVADTEPVTLYYNQRIPYTYLDNGVLKGNLAEITERVFHAADIPFRWDNLPIARQFVTLRDNNAPLCLVGRFKTADREPMGRFTLPIYRDLPQGLLVRRDNARMQSFSSLEAAITSPDIRLLVKQGYSYGSVIDGLIRQRSTPAKSTVDENHNMLRQVQYTMADAMIIAEDEAHGLLAQPGVATDDLVLLKFKDAPPGELRHLLCSRQVSPQQMERLNTAIRTLKR